MKTQNFFLSSFRHTRSLKQMLAVLFLIILLVEGIVFFIVVHVTQNSMYSEAVKNSENLLEYYSNQLDSQISFAEKQLHILANDNFLHKTEDDSDPSAQNYLEKFQLKEMMQKTLDLNGILDGIFMYRKASASVPYYAVSSKYTNYNEELQLKEFITTQELSEFSGHWFFTQIDQKNYLLYLEQGIYGWYGIWIKAQSILQDLSLLNPQSQSGLYVCDLNGSILESQSTFSFNGSFLPDDSGSFLLINGRNYIKTVSSANQEDYVLAALLPENEILKEMSGLRPVLIAAIVINFFLLLLCILSARRFVYAPLSTLVTHMETIKNGDLESRLPVSNCLSEFEDVYSTFNDMQKSILDLKLDNYEKQIREEQTKRQFLQSQIKSHFFLNCLNTIYMLAQGKQCQLIQKLDLCMANYMRYLARPADQPVALGLELEHIDNYMSIQTLRYRNRISFSCELENEELRGCLIYPLMVQTFVENSMKYAIDPEKDNNTIFIKIRFDTDKKENFIIRIQDSGPGFSEELLERLNSPQTMAVNGLSGIGIANVKNRMELFFKGTGVLCFFNILPAGACVQLQLPVHSLWHI